MATGGTGQSYLEKYRRSHCPAVNAVRLMMIIMMTVESGYRSTSLARVDVKKSFDLQVEVSKPKK